MIDRQVDCIAHADAYSKRTQPGPCLISQPEKVEKSAVANASVHAQHDAIQIYRIHARICFYLILFSFAF